MQNGKNLNFVKLIELQTKANFVFFCRSSQESEKLVRFRPEDLFLFFGGGVVDHCEDGVKLYFFHLQGVKRQQNLKMEVNYTFSFGAG